MGFWKKVDDYLKFKGMSRKELAFNIGIQSQTLDRAIQRDSDPKLVEGLKACLFLNIPVNEFLDEPINSSGDKKNSYHQDEKQQMILYRKYSKLIEYCESISEPRRNALIAMAKSLSEAE